MILKWFDAREATAFGEKLAQMLVERTPDAKASVGERMKSKKHAAMLHQLEQNIVRFATDHSLNAYQKAQLGNKFKWTLRDRGYDAEYVDELTNWLMLKLGGLRK